MVLIMKSKLYIPQLPHTIQNVKDRWTLVKYEHELFASNEMSDWFNNHLKGRWTRRYYLQSASDIEDYNILYFSNKDDATLFKLTWL